MSINVPFESERLSFKNILENIFYMYLNEFFTIFSDSVSEEEEEEEDMNLEEPIRLPFASCKLISCQG